MCHDVMQNARENNEDIVNIRYVYGVNKYQSR